MSARGVRQNDALERTHRRRQHEAARRQQRRAQVLGRAVAVRGIERCVMVVVMVVVVVVVVIVVVVIVVVVIVVGDVFVVVVVIMRVGVVREIDGSGRGVNVIRAVPQMVQPVQHRQRHDAGGVQPRAKERL